MEKDESAVEQERPPREPRGSEPTERVAIATGPSGRAVSDLNEAVTEVETEAIEEVIAVAEKIEATGIVLSASGVAKIEVVAAEPRNEAHEVVTTGGTRWWRSRSVERDRGERGDRDRGQQDRGDRERGERYERDAGADPRT